MRAFRGIWGNVMTVRNCILVGMLWALAGCAAPNRSEPVSLELHPLGTTVSNAIRIGGKAVPLDAGEWSVVGTGIRTSGPNNFELSYMLARVADKTLTGAVEIFTNLSTTPAGGSAPFGADGGDGWITHSSCVRDDMHFRHVEENTRLGRQDCWWVNHWRMHRAGAGATEHWTEARKFLEDNEISAPLDMLGVSFRLADKRDFMTVNYFFNPEYAGQTTTKDVYWSIRSWMTSDWHPDSVKKNARKQQFIRELIAWGRGWHDKVKAAFAAKR